MTPVDKKSALHCFDIELCRYIRGNILGQDGGDRLASALNAQLSAPLQSYLNFDPDDGDGDDQREQLLLERDDILDLEETAADLSDRFGLHWEPYESLHRRWVRCVHEIRSELSVQAAEDWSRLSAGFARQLEQEGLSLEVGIRVTGDWISETRRYLSAMRRPDLIPYPGGLWPTPRNPSPPQGELADTLAKNLDATRDAHETATLNTTAPQSLEERLDAPAPQLNEELSLREAAKELHCDPKTAIRYIKDGLLQWRDAAPSSSTRPRYRIKTDSVLQLRNSYRLGTPQAAEPEPARKPRKRVVKSASYQPKHLRQRPLK